MALFQLVGFLHGCQQLFEKVMPRSWITYIAWLVVRSSATYTVPFWMSGCPAIVQRMDSGHKRQAGCRRGMRTTSSVCIEAPYQQARQGRAAQPHMSLHFVECL